MKSLSLSLSLSLSFFLSPPELACGMKGLDDGPWCRSKMKSPVCGKVHIFWHELWPSATKVVAVFSLTPILVSSPLLQAREVAVCKNRMGVTCLLHTQESRPW
mgnify:CR=1 FL=1